MENRVHNVQGNIVVNFTLGPVVIMEPEKTVLLLDRMDFEKLPIFSFQSLVDPIKEFINQPEPTRLDRQIYIVSKFWIFGREFIGLSAKCGSHSISPKCHEGDERQLACQSVSGPIFGHRWVE